MQPPRSKRRIFVVDDELVIASTTALILQHHGFEAEFFTAPRDALQAALSTPPDLLVSDVQMPQLTGIQLAIQLTALYPACRVLLFSGQANSANLLEAAMAEGHSFDLLSKPIHPEALVSRIWIQIERNLPPPAGREFRAEV